MEQYDSQRTPESPEALKRRRFRHALVSTLKKLDMVGDATQLEEENWRDFIKTFSLLLSINLSAVMINTVNGAINGERELLDSQQLMDGWDVFFPAFFVAAYNADYKGNHYRASAYRIIAYAGHAAVAYIGGGQTYSAMQRGVGETDSSLLLSGATGVANAALFVRERRQDKDTANVGEEEHRNHLGLWVSYTSNMAESAGGMVGAGAEALFPGHDISAYTGMGMSAVVGTGMAVATASEIKHLRAIHTRKKQALSETPVFQPVDRDGYPLLPRDLTPDYSE